MDFIGLLQDKIKGFSFAVRSRRAKPSSHTTLWLKNTSGAISRRDQRHSAAGRLRFGLGPNDVAFLPSEWRDINVPPSLCCREAAAARCYQRVPLQWVAEEEEEEEALFLVFPLPLSGDQETRTRASTLSRRRLSGPTPDAATHTRAHSPGGLKSFIYHHHLAWLLKTLLDSERRLWLLPVQQITQSKGGPCEFCCKGPMASRGTISKATNDQNHVWRDG